MTIDMTTAYGVIFLLTISITGTNWYFTRFFPAPPFLLAWNMNMTIWIVNLIMVLVQSRFQYLGQFLLSFTSALQIVFFYRPLIHLSKRTDPGHTAEILFCLAYWTLSFIEIGYLRINLLRPIVNNSILAIICFLYFDDARTLRAKTLSTVFPPVRIFFSTVFLLYGLAYVFRLIMALPAIQSQPLYDLSTYSIFTILVGPQVLFLANAAVIMAGVAHQFTRKEQQGQRYIRHESDALHQHLLAKINHELNTPLGNVRMALELRAHHKKNDQPEIQAILNKGFKALFQILESNSIQEKEQELKAISKSDFIDQLNTILLRGFMANRVHYSYTSAFPSNEIPTWDLYLICVGYAELIQRLYGNTNPHIELNLLLSLQENEIQGHITSDSTLTSTPQIQSQTNTSHHLWFYYLVESRKSGKITTFALDGPVECSFTFARGIL